MTDEQRLQQMIDELRQMREQCEPKSNQNPRYLRYSNAVTALRWIMNDLSRETAIKMLIAGLTTAHVDPTMARTWLSAVHHVARETGGHVLSPVEPPTVGRNHYRVQVAIDGRRLRLLLNAGASLVAAAEGADPHALTPGFCAVPRPDLFTAVGLHVAAPAELEQPLTEAHLTHLDASERQDIAYHRPVRLGDALFNWFD